MKTDFYNTPSRETIRDKDYNHVQQVIWEAFGCQTLGNYWDIYLRTDVLLLANLFETFRDAPMKHYGLDPANYCSASVMSWDALLRFIKVKLELFTDIDQHLLIVRGLRGGIV